MTFSAPHFNLGRCLQPTHPLRLKNGRIDFKVGVLNHKCLNDIAPAKASRGCSCWYQLFRPSYPIGVISFGREQKQIG